MKAVMGETIKKILQDPKAREEFRKVIVREKSNNIVSVGDKKYQISFVRHDLGKA
jgi:hypothetical protein